MVKWRGVNWSVFPSSTFPKIDFRMLWRLTSLCTTRSAFGCSIYKTIVVKLYSIDCHLVSVSVIFFSFFFFFSFFYDIPSPFLNAKGMFRPEGHVSNGFTRKLLRIQIILKISYFSVKR